MLNRPLLRQQIRQQREALCIGAQQKSAVHVAKLVFDLPEYQAAQHIAFYKAHHGELDPILILEYALNAGKTCYFPVLLPNPSRQLNFYRYQPNDEWVKNSYGILEPTQNPKHLIAPEKLECVFTPLIAFDEKGYRIGQGEGYYDYTFRFLNQPPRPSHPQLIGLAYAFQKMDMIIPESWDVRLNRIIY